MGDFLTVKELARYLGISCDGAYRLVKKPDFPAVKFGGKILTDRRRLDEWITNQIKKKG